MRPKYETEENRHLEEVVSSRLVSYWGCEARKNRGIYYPIDRTFISSNGPAMHATVFGFGEIKVRKPEDQKFETWFVSLKKVSEALMWQNQFVLPVTFIVCYGEPEADGSNIYWWQPSRSTIEAVRWGGRYDRGDDADMEPMVHVARANLLKLSDGPPWRN